MRLWRRHHQTPTLDDMEEVSSSSTEQKTHAKVLEKGETPCPKCDQTLILKPARRGGYFLGCPNYPNCKGSARPDSSKRRLK